MGEHKYKKIIDEDRLFFESFVYRNKALELALLCKQSEVTTYLILPRYPSEDGKYSSLVSVLVRQGVS